MYNPMTTKYVRELTPTLPPVRQAFLEAVNDFAYETTYPVESRLGEYAGDKYDRDILVNAVSTSVRKLTSDEGGRMNIYRLRLTQAINDAGFHPNTIHCVEKAVEEEAIKIIDGTTEIIGGKQRFLVRNGHHGRQYIAANAVESVAINYKF